MIKNKKCLIFGGAGSIGSELCRQLEKQNKVYIFDIDETRTFDLMEELHVEGKTGDIRDKESVNESIKKFAPDIIFHAAAYKHVSPSMKNPKEYIQTNILGTINVLNCAKESLVKKLINVSTDKVVKADNIMGATKRVAEFLTRIYGYVSVRFGNVLGSRGSVLPIWQRQMDRGEPLTVTDSNMTRFMMTIQEACELLISAAEIGMPNDILIMDMGEKVNILSLAKDILKKAGKSENIKMIGIRPGESLTEELMNEQERSTAIKKDKFWILHG